MQITKSRLELTRYIYTDGGTGVLRVFKFQATEPPGYSGPPVSPTWIRVDGLNGRMLFVGRGSSRSIEVS